MGKITRVSMEVIVAIVSKLVSNPLAGFTTNLPIYHPWDWYIYLHLVDVYGFHVGINIPYINDI